ncbi:ABC transporter permease [Candidatus Nanoperiomorbus periodonticus]|uniref:ABC transporter permease n=1 Tax=Candidatus Nanoperiomorbus periodonticus TaxID=2171989 RepID=UPI00101D4E68|nr:ABC transporter permease [Candidatus Nanoperiomorbus periodonticus]
MRRMTGKLISKYRYSWILLRELVKTDFKLRYQGSMLGMAWSVLKPLMLFAVMYVVFVRFLRFGAGIPHFAVSLLLAQTLWAFFQEATSQGMQAIVGRGDLLRKLKFPKYIVVVSSTVSALINLVISLFVVLIFMIVNGVEFRPTILLFPLVVVELYIFALGIAFLLSTMFVRFRDIGHIWDVIMQAWFYATPIIYPLTQLINVGWLSVAKLVLMLNPIAQIIQDARYLVVTTQTETIWGLVGQQCWLLKLIPLLIIAIVLLVGVTVFRRRSPYFAEEL